jgi:hypothetical protein
LNLDPVKLRREGVVDLKSEQKKIKLSFPFPFLTCYFIQKHCDTIAILSA